jgi:hypothetical protein
MNPPVHPAATSHHPSFITAPGETDVLMVVAGLVLLLAIVGVGVLYLKLYHLPATYAKTKLQYEIVGALALLALLTQMHIFWVAGLILALVEFPDFGRQARRIAEATVRMAGAAPPAAAEPQHHAPAGAPVFKLAAQPQRPAVPWAVACAVLGARRTPSRERRAVVDRRQAAPFATAALTEMIGPATGRFCPVANIRRSRLPLYRSR